MKATILMALGLMSLMQHASAADPQTHAGPSYYYTEGGRNDPFVNFAGCFQFFGAFLDRYDQLSSLSGSSERQNALLDVKFEAWGIIDAQPKFEAFFVKSHLPPDALTVSKPLFDALKNEEFIKQLRSLIPNFDAGNREMLERAYFEKVDIDHLRRLYAVYATLPFPTDKQLGQYMHAWDFPGESTSWR
jgi:hypothetical protein